MAGMSIPRRHGPNLTPPQLHRPLFSLNQPLSPSLKPKQDFSLFSFVGKGIRVKTEAKYRSAKTMTERFGYWGWGISPNMIDQKAKVRRFLAKV